MNFNSSCTYVYSAIKKINEVAESLFSVNNLPMAAMTVEDDSE